MRLVLDTNVVASALLWQGPPRQLLTLARVEDVLLFSSLPLLAELSDILSRSKFEKKISASLLTVDQLVDLYAELVALVRPVSVPHLAPDPDDDVVIGTAIAAKAEPQITLPGSTQNCGAKIRQAGGVCQEMVEFDYESAE